VCKNQAKIIDFSLFVHSPLETESSLHPHFHVVRLKQKMVPVTLETLEQFTLEMLA
jgi:hypothetical protein